MKHSSFSVESDSGETLQDFLAARMALSRNRAKALIDARSVLVNRRRVWMARHVLRRGDLVEVVDSSAPAPDSAPIPILFEDNDFLVVNKPAGILANGPDSAESRLRAERNDPGLRAAHRLDRDTSGCLLIARSDAAFADAVAVFRERDVGKTYRAIVAGRAEDATRTISFALDGLDARTRIRTISAGREATHLEVVIETGRTHQIRRHLAMIGHPVLGDRQHWKGREVTDRQLTVPRQMLHSHELSFTTPSTGHSIRAFAPLPADFLACLSSFGLRTR